MRLNQKLLMVVMQVCVATATATAAVKEDVDVVDTEAGRDTEAALKCDACKVVAHKFVEAFTELQGEINEGETPADEDIISVAESVCDDAWEGYSATVVAGEERLSGPGTDIEASEVVMDEGSVWSRRLQDMCDEFLTEVNDEKILHHTWASDNSLDDHLCRGEGTFAACVTDDWGPWPGDDYDDYEDAAEFGDIHDEF